MVTHKLTENPFDLTDFEEDDSESGSSGTASGGSGKPVVDASLFGLTNHLYLELIRHEEAKIGKGVPITIDPNERKNREGNLYNKGPKSHPLLNNSQKLDGAANNKLNSLASENEQAVENFELQNELRLTHAPAPSSAPSLRRDR